MIPLQRTQALGIVDKRKGTIKLSCIFCERRIGWYRIESIVQLLSKYRISICNQCLAEYERWMNESSNQNFGFDILSDSR